VQLLIPDDAKMDKLWAVCTYFNYAGFKALYNNYFIFSHALKQQKVNLLTIELAFGDAPYQIPISENVVRVRAKSVMWQKERMINYALSILPKSCKYIAWLDGDILFRESNWMNMAIDKFERDNCQLIQLYERAWYMPKGQLSIKSGDKGYWIVPGIVAQYCKYENWIVKRLRRELPFSQPGFAWAADRSWLESVGGIFDVGVVGSGDVHFIDGCLDSYELHKHSPSIYYEAGAYQYSAYLYEYFSRMSKARPKVGFIPTNVYHIHHGELKNRKYQERKYILCQNDYDPRKDIRLVNNVYEWATDKPELHESIKKYFINRQEDN
jgi:hypothetical protein